jgi:hypothetical protein
VVPVRNTLTTSASMMSGRELHCLENLRLLLAALEVPGVSGAHVHPLEVPDKDLFELRSTNMLPNIDRKLLDDEVVIIHPSGWAGESEVFQPYSGVRFSGESEVFQPYSRVHFPGVPNDVGG